MCLAPVRLKDGTLVACRGCSLCRDNRINDLIGRCVAEQSVSATTLSATLTYEGDHSGAAVLQYRDIQLMLKRLRKAGHQVRYIVAGEYGEAKARAHWHIILFFKKKFTVPLESRINWEFWNETFPGHNKEPYHGFTYFQNPDYKGFKYCMKYALKNQSGQAATKSLAMSKYPPLGHEFFMSLARDIVDRALPILSPEYSFAHVLDRKGKPRRYWLQGRMREMFLEQYCRLWQLTYGTNPPASEYLMEKYIDPLAKAEIDAEWRLDDGRNETGYLMLPNCGMLVVYDNETASLYIGKTECLFVKSAPVAQQLLNSELPKHYITPVFQYLNQRWGFAEPITTR